MTNKKTALEEIPALEGDMWGEALGFEEKAGAVPDVFARILYLERLAYRGEFSREDGL